MLTADKVTELFCMADDFCKFFDRMTAKYPLKSENKRAYHRDTPTVLVIICLIALELDDVDMMARAACLSPNSVKKYHKECRQLVDSLKEEQVNEN